MYIYCSSLCTRSYNESANNENKSQKEKLSESNLFGLQGGAPKQQKVSEENPFALQTRAQNEYLRVVSFVVSSTVSYAVDPGGGSNSAVMTEKSDGTSNFQIGHHTVQSKIESQVGKTDAAIVKLNTQLYTVPVVGFWVEGGQQ